MTMLPFAAQYYLIFAGIWINLLALGLPIAAIVSLRRRRRNRPGANVIFQYLVLLGWMIFIFLAIKWFMTGNWYGENGDNFQTLLLATGLLAALVTLYVALFASSSAEKEANDVDRV